MMYELALIIPVYNGIKKLPKLLDSLLPQLTESVQCVFIDDGSQDESYQFLCEATKEYDTIKVIAKQNQGVASTRNRGLVEASSDYIWFVDGDDWLGNTAITEIQAVLKNTNAPMIHFNFMDHFLNGTVQINQYFLNSKQEYCGQEFYQQGIELFQYELKNMVWSFVFKRTFLDENNLRFDETLPIFEDIIFLAQCYQKNKKIEIINKALYHYQQHPQSLTHTKSHFQIENYQKVVEVLEGVAKDQQQWQKAVSWYCLLLLSSGGIVANSTLGIELLQKNNLHIFAKYPKLYELLWKVKIIVNRGARKLCKQRMLWR
ncbi:MAG: glycosyltransferase family 2 protein [Culicoidibacterales bacterium]